MPALDFPSSPTNGQVFGQYTYDSTKGAWRVTSQPGSTVVASPTPPASPVSGNLWMNTNDGVLFVYYNDGNSSQWVEVKSNTASGSTVAARVDALELVPTGLMTVAPTSVSVASGSATVDARGIVTFTNATNITLNGIFTNSHRHYRIIIGMWNATAQEIFGWFTSSGNPITTGWFGAAFVTYYSGSSGVVNARSNGNGSWVGHAGTEPSNISMDVFIDVPNNKMQFSALTELRGIGASTFGGYGTNGTGDGFRISAASGASTGTIQVYRYR